MTQGERGDILLIVRTERERWEEALGRAQRSDSPAWETECRSALLALGLLEDRLTIWMGH